MNSGKRTIRTCVAVAILASMLLAAGCVDDSAVGNRIAVSSSSGSKTSGTSGTSGSTSTSGSGSTALTVASVAVSPSTLTLNAPNSGGTSAGFATTGQLAATVTFSNGSTSSAVVWTSSNVGAVTVNSSGLVSVQAGAAPQTVQLTATAQADPTKTASGFVSITTNGVLGVTIQ